MPDEINNKKLQYLKRDEIRTMEKDVARLREQESEIARKKVAQIRTEEETGRETEELEQLKIAAEEREKMELETQKGEEELKRLRAEREERAASAEVMKAEEEEREKETIRSQLKKAQLKEEGARRKFLEDVSAKAGERAVEEKPTPLVPPILLPTPQLFSPPEIPPTLPVPPAPPHPLIPTESKKPFKFPLPSIRLPKIQLPKVQLPKVPMPKVAGYFPGKPSLFEKIWIRIVVSLFIIAILITVITFWYWYLVVRSQTLKSQTPSPAPPAITQEIVQEKPEVIQRLLRSGYYLPVSVRVINAIIIHSGYNTSTGKPYDLEGMLQAYKTAGVATHYLIGRDGDIYQLAPDYAIAYHAGAGKMPDNRSGVNNFSIGISLIYQETEAPNDIQYQSLAWLIKDLKEKYSIPPENILGYKDIAPERITPWNFDWNFLNF